MDKVIDFSKNVNSLCDEYPELVDIMVGLGFKPLANPVMRQTMGSFMTIPKAAQMKGIPMEKILFALAEKGFSIKDDETSADEAETHEQHPHEPGHVFLARMGKKRLRPGGKDATEWLLDRANTGRDTAVLEVACNMGTTLIEVAEKYGCKVTGVDLDQEALDHAAENVRAHGLEDKITLIQGNAFSLPFPDSTFDVVINEAMLTMLVGGQKDKALSEYYRVLKPGGRLLTQDVCLRTDDPRRQKELIEGISRAINVRVEPLTADGWIRKMEQHQFHADFKSGPMTLLDPDGMVHDEGEEATRRIMLHSMQSGNAEFFEGMYSIFNNNKEDLGYIAVVSRK